MDLLLKIKSRTGSLDFLISQIAPLVDKAPTAPSPRQQTLDLSLMTCLLTSDLWEANQGHVTELMEE